MKQLRYIVTVLKVLDLSYFYEMSTEKFLECRKSSHTDY